MRWIGAVSCVIVAGAHADLLGVSWAPATPRQYFRISTSDASVELIAAYEDHGWLHSIELGPDGWHYALDLGHVYRVDPFTGHSEPLHGFGDTGPTGALAASEDGHVYSGWWRYSGYFLQGWDIHADQFDGYVGLPDDFGAISAHFRPDGELVVTRWADPTLYTVDLVTDELAPIGSVGLEVDAVTDFATDPTTGLHYMVVLAPDDSVTLHEVDLYTAESSPVGPLPPTIYGISAITACPADFNADGELNVLDFVALQIAWQAGEASADVNGDGVLDVLDFVAFQEVFQKGC